jgi:hypothetical protein
MSRRYWTEPGFGLFVPALEVAGVPNPEPGVTKVGMGLCGTDAPVTLPAPPLLICTLPATFPVPIELAFALMVIDPGTIGAMKLTDGEFTPVPIDPWPLAGPPSPVALVFSEVLLVPTGGGVGVARLIAWPEIGLVCARARCPPQRSIIKTAERKRVDFISTRETNLLSPPRQLRKKVRPRRLELLTRGLEIRCSVQLSYGRSCVW